MSFKQKIKNFLLNLNNEGQWYVVDLAPLEKISRRKFINRIGALFIVGVIAMFILSNVVNEFVAFMTFLAVLVIIVYSVGKRLIKWLKYLREPKRPIMKELRTLLLSNKLYEADEQGIYNQLVLSYMDYGKMLDVKAYKAGDKFQESASRIGDKLASVLNFSLEEIDDTNSQYTRYIFRKEPVKRLEIEHMHCYDNHLKIDIFGQTKIDLSKNFNLLISGSSGGGKSYLTYYILTNFLSQVLIMPDGEAKKHAKLYVVDPKLSDLHKLCVQSGMPEKYYGTTNADAFRIVRAYKTEMDRRMELYAQSTAFDSVGLDIGLEPTLLILEEYSSLVASMDKKQKDEFESMIAIIAQKARQLSMGLCIVMQQPRADSLSTNIKEQLLAGHAFFMGNPTSEASHMMFGTSDVPRVSGVGVGIHSNERSQPKIFEAPMFTREVFKVILPVWKDCMQFWKEEQQEIV